MTTSRVGASAVGPCMRPPATRRLPVQLYPSSESKRIGVTALQNWRACYDRLMAAQSRSAKSGKFSQPTKAPTSAVATIDAGEGQIPTKSGAIKSVTKQTRKLAVPQQRAEFLIEALGSQTRVADLLSVSRSQPGKWSKGQESPSPESARQLIDLDHVVARVVSWLGPDTTLSWLNGSNAFLDGARPIDVLRLRGSSEVIDAIDAEMSGAYA